MTRHDTESRHLRVHQRVRELLPWYVNGSLNEVERQNIEAHLSTCQACQAELAQGRGLATAMQRTDEVVRLHSSAHLLPPMVRPDAAEAVHAEGRGWWERIRARSVAYRAVWRGTPPFMRWGFVVQSAVILFLASAVAWQGLSSQASLSRTLSDGSEQFPRGRGQLRVAFAEDMTAQELSALLADIRGTIVNGPSASVTYTVEVSHVEGAVDDPEPILAALRAHPKVRLAETVVHR